MSAFLAVFIALSTLVFWLILPPLSSSAPQSWFALSFLGFLISGLTVYVFCLRSNRRVCIDNPDGRSAHMLPTPTCGGLGIMLSIAVLTIVTDVSVSVIWIVGIAAALCLLSLMDDLGNLPVRLRLAAHLFASTAVVFAVGDVSLFVLPGFILGTAWMTNLFNFMDGADGLAGGMAVIGFGTYAMVAVDAGNTELALICLIICMSSLGFLVWNIYPARVFMGDCGSIPLGFLSAALGIYGYQYGVWSLHFPFLVFLPFIFDATLTLIMRFLHGCDLTEGHREHLYQRFVDQRIGSPTQLLVVAYVIMIGVSTTAFVISSASAVDGFFAISGWSVLLLVGALLVYRRRPSAFSEEFDTRSRHQL